MEKAGYGAIVGDFVGKKPRTRVAITAELELGAFRKHVDYLRDVPAREGR